MILEEAFTSNPMCWAPDFDVGHRPVHPVDQSGEEISMWEMIFQTGDVSLGGRPGVHGSVSGRGRRDGAGVWRGPADCNVHPEDHIL